MLLARTQAKGYMGRSNWQSHPKDSLANSSLAPKCAHLQEESTTQLFVEGLDNDGGSDVSHAATEFRVCVTTLIFVGDSPLLLLPARVADDVVDAAASCGETRVGISM